MPEAPAIRPPSDPGPATNADPTPAFRRFPWIQLVFCIACLSMAGWTWMMYSYAWKVTPKRLLKRAPQLKEGGWPCGSYVQVQGFLCKWERLGLSFALVADAEDMGSWFPVRGVDDVSLPHWGDLKRADGGRTRAIIGRVGFSKERGSFSHVLYARASRFHPASIAGLVVGAMGCFIFGLYLRRCLRERRGAT